MKNQDAADVLSAECIVRGIRGFRLVFIPLTNIPLTKSPPRQTTDNLGLGFRISFGFHFPAYGFTFQP